MPLEREDPLRLGPVIGLDRWYEIHGTTLNGQPLEALIPKPKTAESGASPGDNNMPRASPTRPLKGPDAVGG